MSELNEMTSKKKRNQLFQQTIPGWKASITPMDFHHPKAQLFHKAIFERMVLDLVGFHEASKVGFLRQIAIMNPNFVVASHTHYRSMLGEIALFNYGMAELVSSNSVIFRANSVK